MIQFNLFFGFCLGLLKYSVGFLASVGVTCHWQVTLVEHILCIYLGSSQAFYSIRYYCINYSVLEARFSFINCICLVCLIYLVSHLALIVSLLFSGILPSISSLSSDLLAYFICRILWSPCNNSGGFMSLFSFRMDTALHLLLYLSISAPISHPSPSVVEQVYLNHKFELIICAITPRFSNFCFTPP
ncbi:uncharacterized protein BDW70DRAFT_67840 [Aspergillus foveolatus]|uniref:uncharacterized protein n=1 Tax=Aspergillus foveolatus TaxID=210207 RepID=UPI003CCCF4FB